MGKAESFRAGTRSLGWESALTGKTEGMTLFLLSIIVFLRSLRCSSESLSCSEVPLCALCEQGPVSEFSIEEVLAHLSAFLMVDFQTPHRKDIAVL